MRNVASRFAIFDQKWTQEDTCATPTQFAEAEFFFLGDKDRVKCWHCNGGLQNWEYDDDPWID